MPDRQALARATAAALAAADLAPLRTVLGFDGFVDQIIDVVDRRHAHDRYDRLPTIAGFGQKITLAAGRSSNFELVVKSRRLGGNGPLMANALARLGFPVDYVGTVGTAGGDAAVAADAPPAAIDPVFHDFATRASLFPLAPPARTNALEFLDGKLMLGELEPLSSVTWPRLVDCFGLDRLISMFDRASLLALVNWTMLPHLTDIWANVAQHVLPRLSPKPRRFFVDLADPEKRSPADLRAALGVLARINAGEGGAAPLPVTLGLNLSEALQVAKAVGVTPPADAEAQLLPLAADVRAALALDTVVVHPRTGAAAATAADPGPAAFAGPFVRQPALSTGAGDHFNAGFITGQLLNLPTAHALCLGTALSGYYVRHAATPDRDQLVTFLHSLPEPQF